MKNEINFFWCCYPAFLRPSQTSKNFRIKFSFIIKTCYCFKKWNKNFMGSCFPVEFFWCHELRSLEYFILWNFSEICELFFFSSHDFWKFCSIKNLENRVITFFNSIFEYIRMIFKIKGVIIKEPSDWNITYKLCDYSIIDTNFYLFIHCTLKENYSLLLSSFKLNMSSN